MNIFKTKSGMLVLADKWLEDEYNRWGKVRRQNPDKYNQIYKVSSYKIAEDNIRAYNDKFCSSCFFFSYCNQTFCLNPNPPVQIRIPDNIQYEVHLHIFEQCNFGCRHCFIHRNNYNNLPVNLWEHIVDNCANAIFVHEFNISGGEPLLYDGLDDLIVYIDWMGADCSIVTNGSLMTNEWIDKNASHLKTLEFSIDSFCHETLVSMGCSTNNGECLTKEKFSHLCNKIRKVNPECKINVRTVVTNINKNEDMLSVLFHLPIYEWTIIKMNKIKNEEFDNSDIDISDDDFDRYVSKNSENSTFTPEDGRYVDADTFKIGDMNVFIEKKQYNKYIIVDSNGWLLDSSDYNT